jgi:uncharacterized Zn finger protein (UPF0148 family)
MLEMSLGPFHRRYSGGFGWFVRAQEFMFQLRQGTGVPLPELWSSSQNEPDSIRLKHDDYTPASPVHVTVEPNRMKLFTSCRRNQGDGKLLPDEQMLDSVKFKVYKFNNRPRPTDKRGILIISCFAEFGCEAVSLMYCIPRLLAHNPHAYIICVGWYGREYLYRHLADEFWEIEDSAMWLREFSNAFSNFSKNMTRIEKQLKKYGQVFPAVQVGMLCVGDSCRVCKQYFEPKEDGTVICPICKGTDTERSVLNNMAYSRKFAVQIPRPGPKMMAEAKKYLKENPVGIFARGRTLYGRNLSADFYVKLIERLEKQGYNPIWLGEKQSVQPCPVPHILDFSRLPESRNLELTLAIVANLKFTVQFWTASTRLASMMGTPWLLFESPDQIGGMGQEGKRIILTTDYNKKKLVIANFFDGVEDHDGALDVVDQAIGEMMEDNWEDILGLIKVPEIVGQIVEKQKAWRCM